MNQNTLWSLRLGFSNKEASKIAQKGIVTFLENSFKVPFDATIPPFFQDSPKTKLEFQKYSEVSRNGTIEKKKEYILKERQILEEMKWWWIDKMTTAEFPLLEKMTCFWHNHFVATSQKVREYRMFQHNQILRKHAFGNFKTLTKEIIQSNAIVIYLDNFENKKNKPNENLSRELLELFTLGVGNYSEQDIKSGAIGLAGLDVGDESAVYYEKFENNKSFLYFGKNGNFKVEEMIDIIFEQPQIPYLITRKILKWFIYDNPKEELVKYYGNYFKEVNFEIKPLLTKIFTEEFIKDNAGSKIKSPLEYILQLINELNIENINEKSITNFLNDQGMNLFNQFNVKGWYGGKYWLSSQTYLQRINIVDSLCNGKNIATREKDKNIDENSMMMVQKSKRVINPKLNWNKDGNNKEVIAELKNRLLFTMDDTYQQDFEKILKYDFDSKADGAENAVLRLFNFMVKTPEFQLI